MDKRLKQVTIALTVLGLLVSIYMTIFKLTNNENSVLARTVAPLSTPADIHRYTEFR